MALLRREAGFGNVDLIRQSALLLAAIVAIGIAYALLGALVSGLGGRARESRRRLKLLGRTRDRRILETATVLWVVPLFVGFIVASAADPYESIPVAAFVLFGVTFVLMIAAPALALRLPPLRDCRVPADERVRRSGKHRGWRLVGVALGGVAIYSLVFLMPLLAAGAAHDVRDGGTESGVLFPWRALPAQLSWEKGDHPQLVNTCRTLRYLGEGNGQILVYDSQLRKTFRLPESGLSVRIDRGCDTDASPLALAAIDRRVPHPGCDPVRRIPGSLVSIRDARGRLQGQGQLLHSQSCKAIWGRARIAASATGLRLRIAAHRKRHRTSAYVSLVVDPRLTSRHVEFPGDGGMRANGRMLSARPGCVGVTFSIDIDGRPGPTARTPCADRP